jgi:hypothetical protein
LTIHRLESDYLVIGAGAVGMAFTDMMVTETPADVVMIDRRHGPGGHWLDAYPFVRLHQPSAFYGVDSTPLGTDAIQQTGPETGMYERATAAEICGYYARVMDDRLLASGQVRFFPQTEHLGGTRFASRLSGDEFDVRVRKRIVDAGYLAPEIPASSPPPFEVGDGAWCVPVNGLATLETAPEGYVIVGSGKTAIDACLWLLENGVDPNVIEWIRPQDPWLTNRRLMQPMLATGFVEMLASLMEAAAAATSLDDLFDRLEVAAVMRRIDPAVRPTMARAPTVSDWEIDQLRRIDNVVRLGHVRRIERDRVVLERGTIPTSPHHVHVHCASYGLKRRPAVPMFGSDRITLQPTSGVTPCYGAAHVAFVEAHRQDDADKNRLCQPVTYPRGVVDWARMWLTGMRAHAAVLDEPDIRRWSGRARLNPARTDPARRDDPAMREVRQRFAAAVMPGLTRLSELVEAAAPEPVTA